jgi:hypothetical protein
VPEPPGQVTGAAPSTAPRLVRAAVEAWEVDPSAFDVAVDALVRSADAWSTAEAEFGRIVACLWARGWTPLDLVHVVGRRLSAGHARLVAEAVVAGAEGCSHVEGWRAQLEILDERLADAAPPRRQDRVRRLLEAAAVAARLPVVPRPRPSPRAAAAGTRAPGPVDQKLLARIRALLAKAEATTFEDEADAFTAKAQELLTRYAIDEALLQTPGTVGEPSLRRILLDDPYASAKAQLVATVAHANGCRAVYSSDVAWVTVFGYDRDLDAVELLVASLLTQATRAMVRFGSQVDAAGRPRTRSFRRAFLLGFAARIGVRLRGAAQRTRDATGDGSAGLLPVLARREERVEAAQRAVFPELRTIRTTASNAAGWRAGEAAAELASLERSPHRLPDDRASR